MFVSGCAALRGDVALLLPGIFFRPFHALSGIT
ncbi:molecular chaperone DnaJ (plasmid) [Escherichia coli]|nr:molecular chaperone DnaJ [Escherichia coli]QAZ75104.1 molecular chaperone DnaJ [Escherichia coli]